MEPLVVSQVLSWTVILVLAVTVLALARQIGVLHERVAPLGALTTRTAVGVGDRAPEFDLADLAGKTVHIGGRQADRRSQLLLFVSPVCPMCKKLLQVVRSFAQSERGGVGIVLMGDGDRPSHEALVAEHRSEGLPLVLSPIVGITLGIGKLPHAVLIDADGVIRSSGIVNSREHLESLLVAEETGYASMQDYLLGASSEKR
ncbi:MAG TPA: methylamine dehydrogenase accessory protein MauD [Geminicoccaceae bacterium]|nr:methylamine dehydrogenase accessory protein MauD [Geminicoccaceae bacterium]